MSFGFDLAQREATDNGELVFQHNRLITTEQLAVLIIKPSNAVLNANNSAQNIDSIIGRIEEKEWNLQAIKLSTGSLSNLSRVAAHYPQPFYDSQFDDLRSELTEAEYRNLVRVWGKSALRYRIYHSEQLVKLDHLTYATIAAVWHAGRGENNRLIDTGSTLGINTVTPVKNLDYGKRRLLLVENNPAFPGMKPFFLVNGFTAELSMKFSRPGERIIAMAFGSNSKHHNLTQLREQVIGETSPYTARPGSIRYDALNNESYTGKFPVTSLDSVGIENNIVHFSDSESEALRELALWLPEMMWSPPRRHFTPGTALKEWENLH